MNRSVIADDQAVAREWQNMESNFVMLSKLINQIMKGIEAFIMKNTCFPKKKKSLLL